MRDYRRKARIGVRYLPHKDKLVVGFGENASNKLTCRLTAAWS